MSAQQIISKIKQGNIAPLYVLHGEESYYIDMVSDWIEEHVLDEGQKAFNQIVIYGKDADARMIVDEARQFPLMGDKKLIVLKEAQDMRTLNDLADYVKKPVPHAILVICHKHKKIDKRYAFGKAADPLENTVEFKKLYDNQVAAWIASYAKEINLKLEGQHTQLLADYLGNDLSKISNELDKLVINIGTKQQVSLDDIQDQIGISKDFNIFELQNALGARDKVRAYIITKYFVANPKNAPLTFVVTTLFGYFSKVLIGVQNKSAPDRELATVLGVNPFFVKDYKTAIRNYSEEKTKEIIVFLAEMDLRSKGVMNRGGEDGALLQDLVYHILRD